MNNATDIKLIVRPHPFETSDFYEANLDKQKINFALSMEGDIQSELIKHSIVFQYGCQTALDSFIRGVPSIKPCNKETNMWSSVTPFIEANYLKKNITSNIFLENILKDQEQLFKDKKIASLLNNLFVDLDFNSSPIMNRALIKTKNKKSKQNHRNEDMYLQNLFASLPNNICILGNT